jgi:hypothetical protein
MRLSRRLTGVLLVLVFAGALAPGALAGKRPPAPPPPTAPAPAPAPVYIAPDSGMVSMLDIEALK